MNIALGNDNVQHIDYTYTLQGWLKAINTPLLENYNNEDAGFAPDKFGMVLGYYNGDFRTGTPWTNTATSLGAATGRDLYNGNISWWTSNTSGPAGMLYNNVLTGYQYRYDKLNRIKGADFSTFNPATTWQTDDRFDEPVYTYDGNGNIQTMQRNGNNSPDVLMDNLTYNYQSVTNKLGYSFKNYTHILV